MKKRLLAIVVCVLIINNLVGCGYQAGEELDETQMSEISDNNVSNEDEIESEAVADNIEVTEEEIYQELVMDGVSYQATKSGIYCETSAGRERIYVGNPGLEPDMQIFEDTLYFKTDIEYMEGNSDWVNCGIKWIDLLTLDSGILELDLGNSPVIENFRVFNGFIEVNLYGVMSIHPSNTYLLSEESKTVYNIKTFGELTEKERTGYGEQISKKLIENPGMLVNVSNRTFTENIALLDMNMDGAVEEITLRPREDGSGYTVLDEHELLLNGQIMIQAYSDSIHNTIWAVSLDGKEILLVLYEDGPSADPYTRIFRYEEGNLVEAGGFGADIRDCEVTQDGIISGTIRRDVIETSFIHMSWQMNDNYRLEEVSQEAYDFVGYDDREGVMLLEDLILHNEPNGDETFGISPQEVKFLKVSGDWRWVLLETMDGGRGWFEVEEFVIVELDKQAWEVFEGLSFAG